MDLIPRGTGCGRACRPRPRGDGPGARKGEARGELSPPPTRGWTLSFELYRIRLGVAPAHAGMDRTARTPPSAAASRPRPRGDGPYASWRDYRAEASPPPTRGWTWAGSAAPPGSWVAPAHAGMDPGRARRAMAPRRRPRPRGDGPTMADTTTAPAWSPPPTRGWTRCAARQLRPRVVAPAHAGMDLGIGRLAPLVGGRPRPRGDGPSSRTRHHPRRASPPPTRGWT